MIGQSIASYRAIVMDSMDELAKAGKLRPGLDTDIASRHMLRTIAGIAQWFHYDFEGNLELIISQTADYTGSYSSRGIQMKYFFTGLPQV